ISPRARKRMLHHGHELDMRETYPLAILDQLRSQLPIGEPTVAFIGRSLPGSQVHLVDRDWSLHRVMLLARLHPVLVAPGIGEVRHNRSLGRWLLVPEG